MAVPACEEVERRLAEAWTKLPASRAVSPGYLHSGMLRARASRLHLASEAWPSPGKPEEHSSQSVKETGRSRPPENKQDQAAGAGPALCDWSPSVGPTQRCSRHSGNSAGPSFQAVCSTRAKGPTADTLCDLEHQLPFSEL